MNGSASITSADRTEPSVEKHPIKRLEKNYNCIGRMSPQPLDATDMFFAFLIRRFALAEPECVLLPVLAHLGLYYQERNWQTSADPAYISNAWIARVQE